MSKNTNSPRACDLAVGVVTGFVNSDVPGGNWMFQDELEHRDYTCQVGEIDGPLCWALTALLVKSNQSIENSSNWGIE